MKSTIRLSIAILAFSAATTGAFAQAGTLDPDFGIGGIGTYVPLSSDDAGYDILTLDDNSMLVCGYSSPSSGFLTHILEDGTVDASFGEANGYTFLASTAIAMALAPDQSIYLAGVSSDNFFLAHFSASGIPDANFGSEGVVLVPFITDYIELTDMVVQPDGKVVLVGNADFDTQFTFVDPLFVRFLPDGTLDTGFNGTGTLIIENPGSSEFIQAVALLDEGSIVGAGFSENGSSGHIILIKLNPDGTLDASFGTAGMLSPVFGGLNAKAYGMTVKEDAMYVVGYLWQDDSNEDAFLAKFNADGTLDSSFGTDGMTRSDFGIFDYLFSVAAQSDGKIVACGGGANGTSEYAALTIRYGTNGLLDPTFGDGGKTITAVGLNYDLLQGIAVQPDGKIVVTGAKYDEYNGSMMVMRYLGDGNIGIAENVTAIVQYAVFPDPVTGSSTTLSFVHAEGAEVWITDMRGRMTGAIVQVPQGETYLELQVQDLASGMYLVNVLSQGVTTSMKMQVTK